MLHNACFEMFEKDLCGEKYYSYTAVIQTSAKSFSNYKPLY